MRILYCNKYNFAFSGTEAYLFAAMEMMRSRGHETALFSMADVRGNPSPFDQYFVSHIDFKTAQGFFKKTQLAAHAVYSLEARRKIRGLIREFRPDVAHMRNIYHHLSPSILWELKAQGVPVLYHVNDFKLLCPSYNMVSVGGEACDDCTRGKFRNAIRRGCCTGGFAGSVVLAFEAYFQRWLGTYQRCIDLLLAPSLFVKEKFIESGWDAGRIQVLPHFQDVPSQLAPHPGRRGTILYFGRLSPQKGVRDLILTAAQFPNLEFVIAGDGPSRRELEGAAASASLRNVKFVGHVSGEVLRELIEGCQFSVFPSRAYETFGKSILESYAQGRAVIASDLGSRRELVQEGETGILYRAGSVEQLAAAIEFLSERPELSRQMGDTGRKLVVDRYSQDRHFLALNGIYEQLCRSAPSLSPIAQRPRVAFIGGRGVVGKYSGVETFYEEAGRRLAAHGHQMTAYCRSYFTPEEKRHNEIRIVRLPTIRSKHLETLVHTFLSTVHSCFSDYDIVHFHTLGPSLFAYWPRLFGKKTVVSVQGLDWQRKKWSWLARQVLRAGERASIWLPNKTVVVSHTLEDHYRAHYRRSVAYIPNGTEMRVCKQVSALTKFGLTTEEYVLFLGRFSPEKNCDLLIRAFEPLNTVMKLVLAGGSSHTDNYVAVLRQRESDRITFLDWLSGDVLEQVLTNAAVFVLPSDMEGLSLALLDAMGAGRCVLASNVPENCEVIGDAGFTLRRGDARHLQQMLAMLIAHPEVRSAVGQKARDRIQQEYLWDGVVQRLEQTYLELMEPQSTATGAMQAEPDQKAA